MSKRKPVKNNARLRHIACDGGAKTRMHTFSNENRQTDSRHNIAKESNIKSPISIEGMLLMLDDTTPHVAVPVQAIRLCRNDPCGRPVATTLSDEGGKYQFINLKPGRYQVRCQVLDGYVYYGQVREAIPRIGEDKVQKENTQFGDILQVEEDKTLEGIDFRFAHFKKGVWKNYTTLDGLANNAVHTIYRDPDGSMWFGTQGGGVSRFDGETFVNFTIEDGLNSNIISAIYRDPDGVMWFGQHDSGGGVSRYDGNQY